jgi:hypothetical protein
VIGAQPRSSGREHPVQTEGLRGAMSFTTTNFNLSHTCPSVGDNTNASI